MILIVGARGRLGGTVARNLLASGSRVRVLSRTPAQLDDLEQLGAEVVGGDLRDPATLARACQGVDRIVASAHAFDGTGANTVAAVDGRGNRALIDAARAAGVAHFVLTSIIGARPDHPIDLWRAKASAESHLRASGLSYTILRPTAYMETWIELLGEPIVRQGKPLIFGRGANPINFVAVNDVARFARLALDDDRARNQILEIGGPENLTLLQVARAIERALGRVSAAPRHVPRAMMRLLGVAARPISPMFARQARAGILMDTADMTFDPTPTLRRFPLDPPELTRLTDVVARRFCPAAASTIDMPRGQTSASASGTPT